MARHANSTSFKPGTVNNPRGRPKALVDVVALARKQTGANLEVMIDIRDNCEDTGLRLRAAHLLHEIAWGKPAQAVAVTGAEGGPIVLTWKSRSTTPPATKS